MSTAARGPRRSPRGLQRLRTLHWGWWPTALIAIPAAYKTWPDLLLITGILLAAAICTWALRGHASRLVIRARGGARITLRPRPRAHLRWPKDPYAFEAAIARLLTDSGCRQAQALGGAGDLGKDVEAYLPDGRLVIAQCKRYGPNNRVGSQDMQCFGGTCYAIHHADIALFVTTSTFTQAARDYATRVGIHLIDGPALADWAAGGRPPWN